MKKKIPWKEMTLDKWILIMAAGILLLVIAWPVKQKEELNQPSKAVTDKEEPVAAKSNGAASYEEQLEQRLAELLAKVSGVGEVDVMITLKASQELVLQTDYSKSNSLTEESDSQGGNRQVNQEEESLTTVLIDNGGGEQVPYVLKELSPQIEGVIVSAQGGDSSVVKSEIIDAVVALFDLPVHKIKVLKKQ